jgi:flavin reductase (DIM6/NTAB) family NADH-FMN oxidoreductase RutF
LTDDVTTPQAPDASGFDAFAQAFRRHAAGVAIITAVTPEGRPVGFTATSLASLAATPPLATFNMARTASSWPAIEQTEYVAIHILGERQFGVAQILAGDNAKRFDGDHWEPGPHGLPIIRDVPAWMVGRIVARTPVADNAMIAVQITEGALGAPDEPLTYHERAYRALGAPLR